MPFRVEALAKSLSVSRSTERNVLHDDPPPLDNRSQKTPENAVGDDDRRGDLGSVDADVIDPHAEGEIYRIYSLDGVSEVSVLDGAWHDAATKIDLAKAYQEMGDVDGAREILESVLDEGDDQQQFEAKQLLDKLPPEVGFSR